jgi:hypothetical protein
MTMQPLLDAMAGSDDHVLLTAAGMPTLPSGIELPADVRTFNERASGAILWRRRDRGIEADDAYDGIPE